MATMLNKDFVTTRPVSVWVQDPTIRCSAPFCNYKIAKTLTTGTTVRVGTSNILNGEVIYGVEGGIIKGIEDVRSLKDPNYVPVPWDQRGTTGPILIDGYKPTTTETQDKLNLLKVNQAGITPTNKKYLILTAVAVLGFLAYKKFIQ